MTDDPLLILAFILFWISLALLSLKSSERLKTFLTGLGIHFVYFLFFIYYLLYDSQEGLGLIWWFYLLVSLGTHTLVNLVVFILRTVRTR